MGRVRRFVALFAAVGAAAVAVVGCSDDPRAARPGAEVRPVELRAGSPSLSGPATPLAGGELGAGRFRTNTFHRDLTFTLGAGWELVIQEPNVIFLANEFGRLTFVSFRDLLVLDPPITTPVRSGDPPTSFEGRLRPAPLDFFDYLRGRDEIEVSSAGTGVFGTHETVRLDYTVRALPAPGKTCFEVVDSQCFSPFMMRDNVPYSQAPGERGRLYVIRGTEPPIGVFIDASSDADMTVMFGLAERVIAELEIA